MVSVLSITLNNKSTAHTSLNYTSIASTSLPPSLVLLGGGANWAAGNGSSALFIDWKDNWLAHHLTDGSTWGPWPSLSDMDNWTFSISYTLNQFGLSVDFAGDMPESLDGYDVVVIHAYWAVEPQHEPLIKNYILNGGGVVILAGVPSYFTVYCKDWWPYRCGGGHNLSSIQEWFGSWFYKNTGGYANVTVDNPFGTELISGDTLIEGSGYSNAAVKSLHNDTQVLAEWGTGLVYSFTHEYGQGRVYYQAAFENIPVVAVSDVSITPITPNYNESVVVSAIIQDGVGIDQAFLYYTLGGEWHNVSMNRVDSTFSATIPMHPYGTLVEYKIYANDTVGRWAVSPTYSYTVSDLIPPEILTVDFPAEPTQNDTVKVIANISEPVNASGISTVLFSFRDCFGQWWNTTMTYDGVSGLWNVILPQQPHNTTVKFYIVAYDNAGNVAIDDNSGEYYMYTVIPEFSSSVILLLALAVTSLAIIIGKRLPREL